MHPNAVGHPVITGTGSSGDALMEQFIVTNYSTKRVEAIECGWRTSAPVACSGSTLPVGWQTAKANINIAPGAEATITTPKSLSASGSSKNLAEQADAHKTPVVLVVVGIVMATYADGSTWVDDEAVNGENFDNGKAEQSEGCYAPTPKKS